MRIVVDRDRCLGNGLCESVLPGVFAVDEQSKVVVLVETVDPGSSTAVEQVVGLCPTQAISIVEP